MASHGGTCPLCRKYASVRKDGRQYVHKGDVMTLIGAGFRQCRASGATYEQARAMRQARDERRASRG